MLRILRLLVKEVFYTVLLILGVTALLSFLFRLMPGTISFEKNWLNEYLKLLQRLFTFNFGVSPVSGLNINQVVFPAFKNTFILTFGAILISVIISVPIGIFSAYRSFRGISWPLTMFSYIVSSIPVFFLGYLVIYLFTRYSNFIPIYSATLENKRQLLAYILPILVLGLGNDSVSEFVRIISDELSRVMSMDYVVASKARGESVIRSSIVEGILIPLVTIIFSRIPFLIGGAIIVEYVFNWPGMGRLAFQSTLNRDLPVLVVIAFLSVLFVRGGMIIKDIILGFIIPQEM
ncbi:MAG: hypothetical protein DRP84_04535 [Spirochaetes bacterium]|nr:MAG: hypothetical protein DRP84_04535 [Spirochaetota bacterium]